MKITLFIPIFFFIVLSVFGQNLHDNFNLIEDRARYEAIQASFKAGDYLNAIQDLNKFIPGYTSYGFLYYNRGIARMALNDINGARKDFI